jgi:hypothetical protein
MGVDFIYPECFQKESGSRMRHGVLNSGTVATYHDGVFSHGMSGTRVGSVNQIHHEQHRNLPSEIGIDRTFKDKLVCAGN